MSGADTVRPPHALVRALADLLDLGLEAAAAAGLLAGQVVRSTTTLPRPSVSAR
ncbi:hypothetical protein C8D89_112127 [Actinomycetospora cinnamomea]|uniref:Uncharacterized protein n=1 Tax=Actinomycetospora cinnamomea TaxID=663609 RepID=A0A2U1F435_9PSEU|nr:hypothetical protein C8D89_112127 [Actinomycetospora cinnamomea]